WSMTRHTYTYTVLSFAIPDARLDPQAIYPRSKRIAGGAMQSVDLLHRELRGELERRQPRGVQNLVRVGVPYPREQRGIGERPLERVRLARERRPERGGIGREHVDPAGVVCSEGPRA